MKKGFSNYLICWAGFVLLFNVISFVTPENICGVSKFSGGFWPGYAFIMVSFLLLLLAARDSLSFADKWEKGTKTACIIVSTIEMVIMLALGMVCMFVPAVSARLAIILCTALLVISLAVFVLIRGTSEHAAAVNNTEKRG